MLIMNRKNISLLFLLLFSCKWSWGENWEESYREAARRSLVPEVDLILVPEPYSIIDEKWLAKKKTTTYNKSNLKKQVERYGGDWSEFLEEHKDSIVDKGSLLSVETEGTSHYTNFSYDRKIPILFFGKKYFRKGIYQDLIFQQHIVPTIAKIIGSPLPDDSKLPALDKIIGKPTFIQDSNSLTETPKKRPEVVVTIVIDQGGIELYKSHSKSYPNIKKLMDSSAYFPNAEVGHIDAHTGVGHVAIGTGAFPRDHRIIANSRTYLLSSNSHDPGFKIEKEEQGKKLGLDFIKNITANIKKLDVGVYTQSVNRIQPGDLRSETLADVWDRYRNNKPVIISQCYAVRGSIGIVGHGGFLQGGDKDIVYWLDKKDVSWKTNPTYYSIPSHTGKYNLADFNVKHNTNPWWRPSDTLNVNYFSKNFYKVVATPTQARLEGELFRETVRSELIGKEVAHDGETDLLYLTIKATDAVGHAHGWESEEARLVLEEADKQVGLIWEMMEEEWGDDFVLVLTADHGAAPLREFSKGMYLKHDDFIQELQSLLPERVRENESLVFFYTSGQLSLNRDVMDKHGISEYQMIQKIKNIRVDGKKFFRDVLRRKDLE